MRIIIIIIISMFLYSCNRNTPSNTQKTQNLIEKEQEKILSCENITLAEDSIEYLEAIGSSLYSKPTWTSNINTTKLKPVIIHEGNYKVIHKCYLPTPEMDIIEDVNDEVLLINDQYISLNTISSTPLAFYTDNILLNKNNEKILILIAEPRYITHTDTYHYIILNVTDNIKLLKHIYFKASCLKYEDRNNMCYGIFNDKFYISSTDTLCNQVFNFINIDSLNASTTPEELNYVK